MSRCFPYPPPGFVKKGISDEPLIESIKLQGEIEKAKKEQKREKKREKKEKKHHHRKERHQDDENDAKRGKKREHEAENLDKSGVTIEEHPVGSQNSSDSTMNSNSSNKRQKQNSSPDGRQNTGSILRIRLPLQRHKDPEVLPREEVPSGSRLPLQRNKEPEVLPREEVPSQLPTQKNKDPEVLPKVPSRLLTQRNNATEAQPFRLPVQRINAPEVLPKEKFSGRLPLQSNKEAAVLPREQQPCQLPLQRNKRPETFPKEEQCKMPLKTQKVPQALSREKQQGPLPLKRKIDQEVLPIEKKTCLGSLQKKNDTEVSPVGKLSSRLPPQMNNGPTVSVVSREEQPSRLALQKKNAPSVPVLSKEEQPSKEPLHKHKDPQVITKDQQLCSISERKEDFSAQGVGKPAPRQGKDEGEQHCSTSKNVGKEKKEKRVSRRVLKAVTQYSELIENWVEPPLFPSLFATDIDDDDGWLLKTNKNQNCAVEKCSAAVSDSLSCGDSVSWPRARLLPEVDIYALPFTVPF